MRLAVIVALAIFWLVMAYLQFQRGHMVLGIVFIVVGIVLTLYRLRR